MSKTLIVLSALALVWLTVWSIVGYHMLDAGADESQADYVATPATRLERGAEVRVEGTIVEGATVSAPFSQKPCLAAVTDVGAVSFYTDSSGKSRRHSEHIVTVRTGPPHIAVAVGEAQLELPLERWSPPHDNEVDADDLPPTLDVPAEAVERANERAGAAFVRYSVAETAIIGGTRVFVVAKLEDREGPLRLDVDPVLERVVLFPGSQAEYVADLRSSRKGLRITGWIFGAGVAPLPLAVILLVLFVRRRRARQASAA